MQNVGDEMKEISTTRKLIFATIVVAGILVFYSVGVASNLFGNSAFSMFWIVSNQAAYNIATYAAVAGVIAVVIVAVTILLIKRQKLSFSKTYNKPIVRKNKLLNETLAVEEMDQELDNSKAKSAPLPQINQ